jgi:hypothetical protein
MATDFDAMRESMIELLGATRAIEQSQAKIRLALVSFATVLTVVLRKTDIPREFADAWSATVLSGDADATAQATFLIANWLDPITTAGSA